MGLGGYSGSTSDSDVPKASESVPHLPPKIERLDEDVSLPAGSDSATGSYHQNVHREMQVGKPDLPNSGVSSGSPYQPGIEKEPTVIRKRPAAAAREFYQEMPLAELAELLEGRTLDHFQVNQLIGGGGMGAVFRGLDKRLDRVVAIKVIPGSKRDKEMLRRFRLEAQAAARLDHPNIARVFYVGESDEWDYIVFEFIDGVNVRDLVDMEGPLSVDDAVFYTRQVAEALQHSHERDVVHRDIKPSNILVTATGTAKLVDMGLARDTSLDQSSAERTASGVTLGTFDYISPEQARDPRDADVRSDLYSLGCSLFFMLTGSPPFPEGTALQKLLNHGSLPPPDPRGWREDLPDELCQILLKLMAKRPSDRYQKPVELVNDLLLLAELDELPRSQGPTTLAIHPTIAQPTWLETHLPWLVASVLLFGSAIWLQSQTLSSGYPLPSVSFPTSKSLQLVAPPPIRDNPAGASNGVLPVPDSSATGSNLPLSSFSVEGSSLSPPSSAPVLIEADSAHEASSKDTVQTPAIPSSPTGVSPLVSSSLSSLSPSEALASPVTSPVQYPESNESPNSTQLGTLAASNAVQASGATSSMGSDRQTVATHNLEEPNADDSGDDRSKPTHATIVVSSVPPGDVSVQQWESSLYRAVQRALSQRVATVIEIRGRIWLDRPIEISSDARAMGTPTGEAFSAAIQPRELVIRGGAGTEAKIEMARGIWNGLESDLGVIRVRDANLVLQDLGLQTILRETETLPRNIVQLEGSATLDAQRCTFTLQGNRPDSLHLVAIGGREDGDSSTAAANVSASSPMAIDVVRVGLERCFVRGEASVFKVVQSHGAGKQSVQLSMTDTVVAVDGRVLDLVSSTGPSGIERIVRMFCESSTLVSANGFAKMSYIGSGHPLVGLGRTSQACVYWSRPGTPHITVSGDVTGLAENPDLLYLQGTNNAYDQNLSILCQIASGTGRTKESGALQGHEQGWLVERGSDRFIAWKKPLGHISAFHESTEGDFLLTKNMFVPGVRSDQTAP